MQGGSGARRPQSPGTKVVHAGLPSPEAGTPFLAGPVLAAPYHLPGDPHQTPYGYGRYDNPTWAAYERALAELDGADHATAFASGMAACAAVMLSTLTPGDVFVAPTDGYPMLRTIAQSHLAERGVESRLVPTAGDWIPALSGARLVWLESPSNPRLDVCDIRAIAAAAHEAGAIVAVDNTLLTPLRQRPLELGADLAVYADTKAMTGHADLLMGHVATRDAALAKQIRDWRSQTGSVPGPFETWLAHRSLATLDVRLARQIANAEAIAAALSRHDEASDVRQAGMIVSFTLDSAGRAQRFIEACDLVLDATSFGGVHSTAERRARWGHGDDVPEGFVRLSAGIEATEDVLADVQAALSASG
ncbi:MAG TPA: cystathionine gamma-lyase [Thermoleophilaceae bacterium]|jgi:cystathionine gamma-lyase|nr:cystathionine gamma-lyase [Thermoleophilaceae bacterium]